MSFVLLTGTDPRFIQQEIAKGGKIIKNGYFGADVLELAPVPAPPKKRNFPLIFESNSNCYCPQDIRIVEFPATTFDELFHAIGQKYFYNSMCSLMKKEKKIKNCMWVEKIWCVNLNRSIETDEDVKLLGDGMVLKIFVEL